MRRYLLDTTPLGSYLLAHRPVVSLVQPWIRSSELATSILVYGEIIEYLQGRPDFARRRAQLRRLLLAVVPLFVTYGIVERYAGLRRQLRPPYGPGLIGDIDTLIAATCLEYDLTLVTCDGDFRRVPGLRYILLDRTTFAVVTEGNPDH
jgi:predicted nucleic acid-binding protein